MKKALAILLCLQVLSGNTFATEIMKLPLMIQHYFEHESHEHPNLGFATYLWEHYVEDHVDEEGHCDEKIPFKHCHDCCSHHVASAPCVMPETSAHLFVSNISSEISFVNTVYFLSQYNGCIWQPPKIG